MSRARSTLITGIGELVTNEDGWTALTDAARVIEDEAVAWTGPARGAPAASDAALRANLARLAAGMLGQGTTTFECQSGYGLTVAAEARALALAAEVTGAVTYLGAHVVPPEFAGDVPGYVDLVRGPMLD